MLDEPQHRVGDDVVEAVVGVGVRSHQLDAVLASVRRAYGKRPAVVSLAGLDVLVGHRGGDPGGLPMGGQPDQRRHEPAGSALDLPTGPEGHRAAVGDKHHRRVRGHRRPIYPARGARPGSLRTPGPGGAHCPTVDTKKPVWPSEPWSGIPPTAPPMNGRAFQMASVTVRPKPSRVDFWITTSQWDWNAFTSIAPTLLRLLRMWMSGSPSA